MMVQNPCNAMLEQLLEVSQQLLLLADEGDMAREDIGCGVLYGTVRDCAYKIRSLAMAELEAHQARVTE